MVWGAFSADVMGPIVRVNGTMDAQMYKEILENNLLTMEDDLPLAWIFQHDNDPKHKSKPVTQYLAQKKISVLPWPAQSPDLNPVEHLWEHVSRQLKNKRCSNATQLIEEITAICSSIPRSVIEKLVESMPRGCAAVIVNKGYATRY